MAFASFRIFGGGGGGGEEGGRLSLCLSINTCSSSLCVLEYRPEVSSSLEIVGMMWKGKNIKMGCFLCFVLFIFVHVCMCVILSV